MSITQNKENNLKYKIDRILIDILVNKGVKKSIENSIRKQTACHCDPRKCKCVSNYFTENEPFFSDNIKRIIKESNSKNLDEFDTTAIIDFARNNVFAKTYNHSDVEVEIRKVKKCNHSNDLTL